MGFRESARPRCRRARRRHDCRRRNLFGSHGRIRVGAPPIFAEPIPQPDGAKLRDEHFAAPYWYLALVSASAGDVIILYDLAAETAVVSRAGPERFAIIGRTGSEVRSPGDAETGSLRSGHQHDGILVRIHDAATGESLEERRFPGTEAVICQMLDSSDGGLVLLGATSSTIDFRGAGQLEVTGGLMSFVLKLEDVYEK